jgi:hypothetical protein
MPSLSEHDNDPPTGGRQRGLAIAVLVAAVIIVFVLLHLTGVIGPGSH